MKDLKLTTAGDIAIEFDEILLVEKESDLTQSLRIILSTRLSEFWLDESLGLNWDNMLGKNFDREYLETDIQTAITEQEKRIKQITKIEITTFDRRLVVKLGMIGANDEILNEELVIHAE